MNATTRHRMNGFSKHCAGCGEPLPVRKLGREAQVGLDGRIYCYALTPRCAVLAVTPALKKAA